MGHQALDMFTTLGLSKKEDNSWHNSQGCERNPDAQEIESEASEVEVGTKSRLLCKKAVIS